MEEGILHIKLAKKLVAGERARESAVCMVAGLTTRLKRFLQNQYLGTV
jgi:hypothetical protein